MMKSHYQILNLPPSCTQAEIKKAYRLLAVQYHPDKNTGDSSSEEHFKLITAAYLVLGNVAKRAVYDNANGFNRQVKPTVSATGHTASGILLMCKKVKEKVFNAGGRINKDILFKLVNDILSDANIYFLIDADETAITSLITDEILVCAIFMDAVHKQEIREKLLKLANGNVRIINRISTLDNVTKK